MLGAWLGPACAQAIPVTLAWQPVAAASAPPAPTAWRAAPSETLVAIARSPRGAWLRLAPALGAWPDAPLAVELQLRTRGDVTLVDAAGRDQFTTSLDPPRAGQPHGHGVTLVMLPRPADPRAPVVMRLEPARLSQALVEATVRTAADEAEADAHRLAFLSACLAVLACTAVYALLFGVVMRDVTYLYYAAYVLGFAGLQSLVRGFAVNLFELPWLASLRPPLLAVCACVSAWGAARFLVGFVDLARHAPRVARALRLLADGLLVACALALLPVHGALDTFAAIANPLLMLTATTMLAGTLVALAHRARYVLVYLLGWLPLLGVTIVDSGQALGAFTHWLRISDAMLAAGTFETVVLVYGITLRAHDLRSDRDRTRRIADTDGLTGVLNRRGWQREMAAQAARAGAMRKPLALLFIDLDHFKAFNDHHGHACGDQLLVAVAAAIPQALRPGDLLGRYGGEEFVVLLPGCDEANARATAERVRACIERVDVPAAAGRAGTTASIGVSVLAAGEAPAAAMARADGAMYASKRAGRNRACMA